MTELALELYGHVALRGGRAPTVATQPLSGHIWDRGRVQGAKHPSCEKDALLKGSVLRHGKSPENGDTRVTAPWGKEVPRPRPNTLQERRHLSKGGLGGRVVMWPVLAQHCGLGFHTWKVGSPYNPWLAGGM